MSGKLSGTFFEENFPFPDCNDWLTKGKSILVVRNGHEDYNFYIGRQLSISRRRTK